MAEQRSPEADEGSELKRARETGFNTLAHRILRRLGEGVAVLLEKTPVTPNQVTLAMFLVILTAISCVLSGSDSGFLACSLLLFLGAVLDCADGSLARRRNKSSLFGAYLDESLDDIAWIFLALGLCTGLYNYGIRGLAVLAPLLTYFGDTLIQHTLTRYRKIFIDPLPQDTDLEKHFRDTWLLNLARNLIPPFFPRQFVFPLFAWFGAAPLFLVVDAVYTNVLALLLMTKTGRDIRNRKS